jgi:dihydroxyacetone kinase-like predicted kinase
VAGGPGIRRLYEDLGAVVVDGGPTMNPSTAELAAGIGAAPADEVLLLPNSPNVLLAAERAAELAEKDVRVVPTRAQQEGLAALFAFDPAQGAKANAEAVAEAARGLSLGGVARAARDDARGRFRAGDAVGYVHDELVAWGEPELTLRATAARVAEGTELLTCIAGEDAPLERDGVARCLPGGVELDYHEGGQPAWWWLLCAE